MTYRRPLYGRALDESWSTRFRTPSSLATSRTVPDTSFISHSSAQCRNPVPGPGYVVISAPYTVEMELTHFNADLVLLFPHLTESGRTATAQSIIWLHYSASGFHAQHGWCIAVERSCSMSRWPLTRTYAGSLSSLKCALRGASSSRAWLIRSQRRSRPRLLPLQRQNLEHIWRVEILLRWPSDACSAQRSAPFAADGRAPLRRPHHHLVTVRKAPSPPRRLRRADRGLYWRRQRDRCASGSVSCLRLSPSIPRRSSTS